MVVLGSFDGEQSRVSLPRSVAFHGVKLVMAYGYAIFPFATYLPIQHSPESPPSQFQGTLSFRSHGKDSVMYIN